MTPAIPGLLVAVAIAAATVPFSCSKRDPENTKPVPTQTATVAVATPAATLAPTPAATPVAVEEGGAETTTIDAIIADPARWHGKRVHVKATLSVGFEASHLDGRAWVNVAKYEGFPEKWRAGPRVSGRAKVEAWGKVDTEKGRYGHLGKSKVQFDAERVVYLGPVTD